MDTVGPREFPESGKMITLFRGVKMERLFLEQELPGEGLVHNFMKNSSWRRISLFPFLVVDGLRLVEFLIGEVGKTCEITSHHASATPPSVVSSAPVRPRQSVDNAISSRRACSLADAGPMNLRWAILAEPSSTLKILAAIGFFTHFTANARSNSPCWNRRRGASPLGPPDLADCTCGGGGSFRAHGGADKNAVRPH